jgi:ribonuclease HI
VGFDPRALRIYIDGNCWKNPGGPGGTAARVVYPMDWDRPDELVDYRGFFETNNQRMELRACIFAHEWALESADDLGVQRFQVFTDSKYVYDGYSWMLGWSRRDYCSSDGRPIKNDPLWRDLMRLRKKLAPRVRIEVCLVAGKSSPIAKQIDKDAKAAGLSPANIDHGFKSGKIGRSKNKVKKATRLYPAAGQVTIIRPYQSVMARKGLELFKIQEFDEVRKDFFEKFEVYAVSTIGCDLHRQHVYRVRMNDLPRFPQVVEIFEELVEADIVAAVVTVSP